MYTLPPQPVSGWVEFACQSCKKLCCNFSSFTFLPFPKLFTFCWTLVHGYYGIKSVTTTSGCTWLVIVTTCKHIRSGCSFLNWNSANFCCSQLLHDNLSTSSCFDKWLSVYLFHNHYLKKFLSSLILNCIFSSSPFFLVGKFLAQRICSILSTISTYVLLSRILLSVTSLTCSISSTTSIICAAACKRDQRKEQEWKLMITQVNHPPPLPHSLTLLSCRRHSNSNTEEKALVVRWKCYKATIKPPWITFL